MCLQCPKYIDCGTMWSPLIYGFEERTNEKILSTNLKAWAFLYTLFFSLLFCGILCIEI